MRTRGVAMSDGQIIEAIRNKDETVMGEVMRKYSGLLWSVASAVLDGVASVQDVEECVADAFVYLWQNPERYDAGRGKLKSWLALTARSRAIDRYRTVMRRNEARMEEDMAAEKWDMLEGVVEQEERGRLWACIRRLEEPDQEAMIRRYYHGQKPKEIAAAMGIPRKQVENRLYQGKQKLRRMLLETQ